MQLSDMSLNAASAEECMEDVYRQIEQALDRLLDVPDCVADSDPRYVEAMDYIKMLLCIASGEWSADAAGAQEDAPMLLSRMDGLTRRLLRCVGRAFERVSVVTQPQPDSALGVDVPLLCGAVNALLSLMLTPGGPEALSNDVLFDLMHQLLHRIADVRITNPSASSSLSNAFDALRRDSAECGDDQELRTTAAQFEDGISRILDHVASNCPARRGPVLCVLVRVMFCCLPPAQVRISFLRNYLPLPAASTKIASRLVQNVLANERKQDEPYCAPRVDLSDLLEAMHDFFTGFETPSELPVSDTGGSHSKQQGKIVQDEGSVRAMRTVKTVLEEVVRHRGGEVVLHQLEAMGVPHSDGMYLYCCRSSSQHMDVEDASLHAQLNALVQEISSARDKLTPIRELHRIKRTHPHLDVNVYLQKISTAFRRYVLNSLARLEAADDPTPAPAASAATAAAATVTAPPSPSRAQQETAAGYLKAVGLTSNVTSVKPSAASPGMVSVAAEAEASTAPLVEDEAGGKGEGEGRATLNLRHLQSVRTLDASISASDGGSSKGAEGAASLDGYYSLSSRPNSTAAASAARMGSFGAPSSASAVAAEDGGVVDVMKDIQVVVVEGEDDDGDGVGDSHNENR